MPIRKNRSYRAICCASGKALNGLTTVQQRWKEEVEASLTGVRFVVRGTVDDSWTELQTNQGPSFLTGLTNLADPPQLTAPRDFDDVTARLDSEASRLSLPQK